MGSSMFLELTYAKHSDYVGSVDVIFNATTVVAILSLNRIVNVPLYFFVILSTIFVP